MIGKLNHEQIEHVLIREMVGRLGFRSAERVYIVPVAFAYYNGSIFAHSREGNKINLMRKYPDVCFQVDSIDNLANWRSVILWGTFTELKKQVEQREAMQLIRNRLTPFMTSDSTNPTHLARAPHIVEKPKKTIVYRIDVTEESGRFEKSDVVQIP
jgi:nitroimidazol reductase NimA-like FMN-containing flavoprotein (pyridoxamine 5'-phosphate oxidase superfamily)